MISLIVSASSETPLTNTSVSATFSGSFPVSRDAQTPPVFSSGPHPLFAFYLSYLLLLLAANSLQHFLLPEHLKKIHNCFSHLERFCRNIFGLPCNVLGFEYLHIMILFLKNLAYLKVAFGAVLSPHCLSLIFYFNEYYLFSLLP